MYNSQLSSKLHYQRYSVHLSELSQEGIWAVDLLLGSSKLVDQRSDWFIHAETPAYGYYCAISC